MEPPLLLFLLLLFSPSVENANERRRQSASSPPPPVVDTAQGKLQGRIVDYNGKQTQVRSRIVLFYVLYGLDWYGYSEIIFWIMFGGLTTWHANRKDLELFSIYF